MLTETTHISDEFADVYQISADASTMNHEVHNHNVDNNNHVHRLPHPHNE